MVVVFDAPNEAVPVGHARNCPAHQQSRLEAVGNILGYASLSYLIAPDWSRNDSLGIYLRTASISVASCRLY